MVNNNTTGYSCHPRKFHLTLCLLTVSIFLFSSTGFAEDVPRQARPTERITLTRKDSLRPYVGRGEIAGDLWAIAYVKRTETARDSQCALTTWQWQNGKVRQGPEIFLAKDTTFKCALAGQRYIVSQCKKRADPNAPRAHEIALKDAKGTTLARWSSVGSYWRVFPSANGKYAAVFSASESNIVSDASRLGDLACRIGLIDVEAGSVAWVVQSQPESLDVEQLMFQAYAATADAIPTNDGKRIAIMPFQHQGKRDSVAVVDVTTQKLLWGRSYNEVPGRYAMRFSSDSSSLFVGTSGPHIVSLDARSGKSLSSWAATPDGKHKSGIGLPNVHHIAVSPDGEYVAAAITGISGGHVYVHSLRKTKTVHLIHGSKPLVQAIAFSPDSKSLATMDSDSICIWSKETWGRKRGIAPRSLAEGDD